MEYRILKRINMHKLHYNNLFRSTSSEFKKKNKYYEILPFEHNMVRIREILNIREDFSNMSEGSDEEQRFANN